MAKQPEKKRPGLLSRLAFGTAALLLCGLLAMSYLSGIVDPAKAWFFTLFGLLYFPLVILTAVFFIWSLRRRSRLRGLLLVMLLPSVFFVGRYFQFKGAEDATEPTLKVVSYNVGLFAHSDGDERSRLALADSVSAFLRRTDADIICLQEFWLGNKVDVEGYLKRNFPGYVAEYYVLTGKNGHAGNVTLSRRPVVGKGKISFERSTNLVLYTDIRLDSAVVRLYNCHFESYNISIPGLVKNITNDEVVEETGRKMRRSIRERPKQVAEVVADVDAAPYRSLVLGDFNDNPLSYTYHRLSRDRRDSFVEAGKGFGATYRQLWPFLRIDYILYPSGLAAVSHRVGKEKYSDHYPIQASFYETRRNSR